KLADRSAELGDYFRARLCELDHPHIKEVRGKGLLNAIVIVHENPDAARELCLALKNNGLLAKPTHGDKIRFAPPLVITKDQLDVCIGIIETSLATLDDI